MLRYLFCALLGFLLTPLACVASSSVQINEIAWMGNSDSSTNEWIELHNVGTDEVSLAGWKLTSADGKLDIALKGSIVPDGYYLIERTDDNSVPGIPADLVSPFGSGLSNGGMTLILTDATGATIDTVIGGTDWKNIGGDNATKNTAQRTVSGWITAVPTPEAPNATEGVAQPAKTDGATDTAGRFDSSAVADSSTDQSAPSSGGGSGSSASLPGDASASGVTTVSSAQSSSQPRPAVRIAARMSDRAFVGVPVVFHAFAYDARNSALPADAVRWNFGDGTTATGAVARHVYSLAGPAVVSLSFDSGDIPVVTTIKLNVLEENVRLVADVPGQDGYVRLLAKTDADISGWSLHDGADVFLFPQGTQLLAGVPATFPNVITGVSVHRALVILRGDGRVMAYPGQDALPSSTFSADSATQYARPLARAKISSIGEIADAVRATATSAATASSWSLAGVGRSAGFPTWAYAALMVFFAVAAGVVIYVTRRLDPHHEFDAEAAKYTLIEVDSNLEDIS